MTDSNGVNQKRKSLVASLVDQVKAALERFLPRPLIPVPVTVRPKSAIRRKTSSETFQGR